jgi:phosphoenolpyruvate---glycerone phosphotransferase subunit DhaL
MEPVIDSKQVVDAFRRVSAALLEQQGVLLELDQIMGDGDLGITLAKIAVEFEAYITSTPIEDLGKFIASAGTAVNRVGSSSMGTLLATALMRAGKEARGLATLTPTILVAMLNAADMGVQERGKAQLGDKTLLDALHPAAEAFTAAITGGDSLKTAGLKMLQAAEDGRDRVTPLQCRLGRGSWLGERTIGKVDPGCAALIVILRALVNDSG